MIFCTRCGTQHQDGDNFCKKCGNPLPKDSGSGGEKIIYILRSFAEECLKENLDILRKRQEWWKKTDMYGLAPDVGLPKHVVWIQFDPTTGRYERLLMTRLFDKFDDRIMIGEDLSQLKPGWHYCRLMTPDDEWQIKAYLDRAEFQVEFGSTTPSMGGYQARFV